ncbi:MAG: OFA family MFS transporter [Deltaproteobacteria bacterium]|nr:OFA family MFS transporter [Deltaproteobacteria bacterium]
MAEQVKNRGWSVTFAGTGINLALGILYTWSIFKGAIKESIDSGAEGGFQWDIASLNDPYAVCCLVFAFLMILGGKIQDKIGPRTTALMGGIMVGLGFILISQSTSYIIWILGFGLLVGTGIAFAYASATPPALKWFPPEKTGLIAGLVVAGFGLASVYIAPLSNYLLGVWGLQNTMMFFGIAFLIVVGGLSMILINPPPGYVPKGANPSSGKVAKKVSVQNEYTPLQMMTTPTFYMLWFAYFIGAGAGLMVIASVAGMAKKSMGELAFLVVAILAIGNAGGRVIAGILSDKIGRTLTLFIMLTFQAVLMFAAIPIMGMGVEKSAVVMLILLTTFIGFNYGTNLSLFPSATKDLWGLKNFGINYGIVFTAWGVGGFVMGRLSQMLKASTGSFNSSFITAGIMLLVGAALALILGARMSAAKTKK